MSVAPIEINLVDSHFAHAEYCVPGVTSHEITWHRSSLLAQVPTVVTHEDMYRWDYKTVPRELRFGLLLESQSIIPRVYSKVREVIPDYALVFTHSERLLAEFPNTRWIPGGGIWVSGSYAGGDLGISPKTREVSMLSSRKLRTPLHRRRYLWASLLERQAPSVDVFRQGLRSNETVSVYDTLRDYRYSIVVENFVDDRYFTEKLLNCFATGTVPIYLGARRLGEFFNPDGVIEFRGWRDLRRNVLTRIGSDDYVARLPAIQENYARALQYRSLEDFIYRNYLAELGFDCH